jgi:hypothetical protein
MVLQSGQDSSIVSIVSIVSIETKQTKNSIELACYIGIRLVALLLMFLFAMVENPCRAKSTEEVGRPLNLV